MHQRLVRLEAAKAGRSAVHVLLHPELAGEALERWKAEAVAGLQPAALIVMVPQRGLATSAGSVSISTAGTTKVRPGDH